MSEDDETKAEDGLYPWSDVQVARSNAKLQRKNPVAEGKAEFLSHARPCPKCGASAGELAWFYFESPLWTWDQLCGRAGFMTVCDPCHAQVDFFMTMLN